jgi:hypothetical protein
VVYLPIANEGTKLARQFPPIKPGGLLDKGQFMLAALAAWCIPERSMTL